MNLTLRKNIEKIIREHISWSYQNTLTKYSYIDQWAFDFINFTQNPSYQWYYREIDILKNMDFISWYDQIIDLWPWNWLKWSILMQKIQSQLQRYIAIDISNQMLDLAKENQSSLEHIERQYIHGDFDDIFQIKSKMNISNLIAILWNTITNLSDMKWYLKDIYSVFHENDTLLLWVEISNLKNIDNLVDEYNTVDNRKLTFRPLEYFWVHHSVWYIDIILNTEKNRIEEWFIFQQNISIYDLYIPKNTKILLSITHKPTLDKLIYDINNSWFKINQIHNNQEQYILCLWK